MVWVYSAHKLEDRSTACVFLGYHPNYKGYRCLDVAKNKVYVSRNVVFDETVFPYSQPALLPTPKPPSSSSAPLIPLLPLPPIVPSPVPSTVPTAATPNDIPTVSTPTSPTPKNFSSVPKIRTRALPGAPLATHSMTTRSMTNSLPPHTFFTSKHPLPDPNPPSVPTCYSQAMKSPEWRAAMNEEFNVLLTNRTWSLVSLPQGRRAIGCKWVFRVKTKPDGSLDRYKARLVAKGFNHRERQDYFETFSPVVKPVTICTVLTLVVGRNWSIRQLDVNNAFLNGTLDEEVYMVQPSGFQDKSNPDAVCRLHKSLYGLKQSPRAWYQRLTSYLVDLGFALSKADSSLLVRYTSTATTFVLIYVDDIIIIGSSTKDIAYLLANLQREFSIKDLGALHYFLGIEVTSLQSGLHLAQTKYTTDILSRLGLSEVKPLSAPIVTGSKLSKYEGTPLSGPSLYRGTVGALQYLTLTRPDIQYAVNQACQFQQNPTDIHWIAGWDDTRCRPGGCPDDRAPRTGFVHFPWWLTHFLVLQETTDGCSFQQKQKNTRDLLLPPPATWVLQPVQRTQGVRIQPSGDLVKHDELDYHFIRERVTSGLLQVKYISTHDQVADVFTKGLPKSQFSKLLSKLRVFSKPLSLRGNVRHPISPNDTDRVTARVTHQVSDDDTVACTR
ncbi:hypothetical protein H6P81_006024 [Aristolochia fimbriata]|uniref:Reverse transcriptase Ty1/copia-type domain-containing protein n=1 Tax=Aristolochia fimbriata TaxID=158543 RepID=A0AAV7EW60_ARIFI|nr:hypothetical protein H6P81_006024 [Aristolochia fimbriata]